MSRADRLTRRRDWEPKLADLALFTGFALALRQNPTGRLVLTGSLFIAASVALALFGYAWNGLCDADADAQAGKDRPTRSELRLVALTALVLAAAFFAPVTHLDALLLALAFATVALSWGYSGRPFRLKERGALGLLAGAVAQRTLPAVFVGAVFNVPVRSAAPWLLWMTCCGLRGMVMHQVHDADNDRRTGFTTWGTRPQAAQTSDRLVAMLVPLEVAFLSVAFLPLLVHRSVLLVALVLLAAWIALTARSFTHLRARRGEVEWRSFRYVPLDDLYGVFAPAAVAVALLQSRAWVAPAWIAVDAAMRTTILRRTWTRAVAFSSRCAPGLGRGVTERSA